MLPAGFFGTRGDILMDVVILAFALILPALVVSWRLARGGRYSEHRKMQLLLASVLAIAVALFEVDLELSGGIFVLTAASGYAGTALLNYLIYGHTLVAVSSALVWIALVLVSLGKFSNPPAPNGFSGTHRFWGRVGMSLMMLSGLTALPLYYLGFAL